MGGRAAEKLVLGHLSTGAADDLSRATQIAREMVTRFAMVPELGNVSFADSGPQHLGPMPTSAAYSDDTARQIDEAVRTIVDAAFEEATDLLVVHRNLLDRGADVLLERETLAGDELEHVLGAARPYARSAWRSASPSMAAGAPRPSSGLQAIHAPGERLVLRGRPLPPRAIVQPPLPRAPELDPLRHDDEAAPSGRPRDRHRDPVPEPVPKSSELRFERLARPDHATLPTGPRRQLRAGIA